MPYSNDRTIVSATDDVRIFDIEHTGHSVYGASGSRTAQSARRGVGIHGVRDGLTLTEGDTNAKAFRCHTDTVKRIVTEDNPFYFLTCSEDGDVRQWDIRQPSKTYPPVRDRGQPRWATDSDASDNLPPPLISYSRYNLDLNTVSCSPSQPHYIALGGAHLHCFLHDRRMLGRDLYKERGAKLPSTGNWTEHDDVELGQATRCVKKFAPNGQQRMGRKNNGHITACKISDANPNELVVSWSGDWIYSFNILHSPDATETISETRVSVGSPSGVKDKSRKRKRPRSGILSQEAAARAGSRQRTESSQASSSDVLESLALRVNYGNGQSEEIHIQPPQRTLSPGESEALSATDHFRLARTTVTIQKHLFSLNPSRLATLADGPSAHSPNFTSVLGFAASILPEMDEISRTWGYPVDPNQVDVALQNQLRDGRAASRRFVQAAGTLARVLGGHLRTGNANAVLSQYFAMVQPAPNERPPPRHEQFSYDFLKAILLWLDSGIGALVEGFSSPSRSPRFPLQPDAAIESIDDVLIPHLLHLAGDDPIVDVDISRFETDDRRILHATEKGAVISFAQALKIPFVDLTGAVDSASGAFSPHHEVQDRKTAVSQWAFKVGRGILLNASKNVRFAFVDRAFGGLGVSNATIRSVEQTLIEQQQDIDPLEQGEGEVDARLVGSAWAEEVTEERGDAPILPEQSQHSPAPSVGRMSDSQPLLSSDQTMEEVEEEGEEDDDSEDSDGDNDPLAEEEEDDDDEPDEDGLSRTRSGRLLWRSDFNRSYMRNRVESEVPCAPHMRAYTGHCNVRTVKDVNFFGLQDEYVVSGSDSGHVFIWDRKTSQLLNILEGDGEVVNVVQGHPYEPTMAVSGIDHTIKIFSPDTREQYNARKGIGAQSTDPGFSSLQFGRRRERRSYRTSEPVVPRQASAEANEDGDDPDEVAPNGLASRKRMHLNYEIISQNDMDRKGGREDAFITVSNVNTRYAEIVWPLTDFQTESTSRPAGPTYTCSTASCCRR
jgi:nuclear receptor interaction protein